MGGPRSGNRLGRDRKATVEESLTLSVRVFTRRLSHLAAGKISWPSHEGEEISLRFLINRRCEFPTITLSGRLGNIENARQTFCLQATATPFGGQRWWFTCPLIIAGIPCGRRVGKLHLPPGERYFGCRHCHLLTYQSSQEAHQFDRLSVRLAMNSGCNLQDVQMLFMKLRSDG
ncbi:hypothetical protein [Zavarzinella formosa]|uniref:hypothetical protein n=1 Tax=Zavarzinella formosa TaxID=360055 RepID=UPI0002E8D9B0|nr:hypothetical protein [Zavarzinella formosa]